MLAKELYYVLFRFSRNKHFLAIQLLTENTTLIGPSDAPITAANEAIDALAHTDNKTN